MIKSSFMYLASGLVGKSVPFLILPLLTTHLRPAEFGLVALIQLGIQFIQSLSGMCLNVNIPRKYFNQEKTDNAVLIFNLYVILFVSCTFLFFITSIFVLFVGDIAGIPSRWVVAMPILAFMSMSNLINLTLIRTREQPLKFMGFEISQAVMNLVLTIYLVAFIEMSWEGRVVAIALSVFFFGVISIFYLMRAGFFVIVFDFWVIRDVLKVSVPLIPHAIAGVVISVSDRFFIERMVGMESVGIYTVGYYFGMVVMLFTDAFVKAWSPWFFKKMSLNAWNEKKKIVLYTYWYICILVIGSFIYSVLAVKILPHVVSSEYMRAVDYIPWICLGYASFGVYQIFFPYLVYRKKTSFVAVATVSAAIVNLIGNYFLIGAYGVVGAAYSTVIAFTLSAFIILWYSMKLVEMPWRFRK